METISIREAAERMGVSAKVVRRLISQGTLRAEKARGGHGEEWRVDPASIPAASPTPPASPASPPSPSATPAPAGASAPRERDELLRDKEFLQRQVEALSGLLAQALAAPPSPTMPVPETASAPEAPAAPAPPGQAPLPAVTAALQSSLRLVDAADVAVIEMCSVRLLWGRPVLWRLTAREEADLAALREAILSPAAAWDAPGEEVVFLFMRNFEGAVVWGCACGPRWFGPAFEDALRAARVERV